MVHFNCFKMISNGQNMHAQTWYGLWCWLLTRREYTHESMRGKRWFKIQIITFNKSIFDCPRRLSSFENCVFDTALIQHWTTSALLNGLCHMLCTVFFIKTICFFSGCSYAWMSQCLPWLPWKWPYYITNLSINYFDRQQKFNTETNTADNHSYTCGWLDDLKRHCWETFAFCADILRCDIIMSVPPAVVMNGILDRKKWQRGVRLLVLNLLIDSMQYP